MDVGVAELRANLSEWLSLARDGQDVVVTERGLPVARLVGIDSAPTIERLTDAGVIARAETPHRPKATGRKRPTARRDVSDHVTDQRR